jgi:hypothetical protein
MKDERFIQVVILPIVEAECIAILWIHSYNIEHALDITFDSDCFLTETEKYSLKGVSQILAS